MPLAPVLLMHCVENAFVLFAVVSMAIKSFDRYLLLYSGPIACFVFTAAVEVADILAVSNAGHLTKNCAATIVDDPEALPLWTRLRRVNDYFFDLTGTVILAAFICSYSSGYDRELVSTVLAGVDDDDGHEQSAEVTLASLGAGELVVEVVGEAIEYVFTMFLVMEVWGSASESSPATLIALFDYILVVVGLDFTRGVVLFLVCSALAIPMAFFFLTDARRHLSWGSGQLTCCASLWIFVTQWTIIAFYAPMALLSLPVIVFRTEGDLIRIVSTLISPLERNDATRYNERLASRGEHWYVLLGISNRFKSCLWFYCCQCYFPEKTKYWDRGGKGRSGTEVEITTENPGSRSSEADFRNCDDQLILTDRTSLSSMSALTTNTVISSRLSADLGPDNIEGAATHRSSADSASLAESRPSSMDATSVAESLSPRSSAGCASVAEASSFCSSLEEEC